MTYTIIGTPRIESAYCDEYETVMVIDLLREDGETGDVWVVAGVPDYQRGSSDASGTQCGYESVRVIGDSADMWCPESFKVEDYESSHTYREVAADVVAACYDAALQTHRDRIREEAEAAEAAIADEETLMAEESAAGWDTIRYSADASICMAEVAGELVAATQELMDSLPLGADLTEEELAGLSACH